MRNFFYVELEHLQTPNMSYTPSFCGSSRKMKEKHLGPYDTEPLMESGGIIYGPICISARLFKTFKMTLLRSTETTYEVKMFF